MQRDLVTAAFVLRTRPYGESDRIVTLLTEDHGKVAGIAKGAKNSRRRFAGTLEPFVHIRAVFRQRPASDLVFLVRCELLRELRGFTRDLDRYAAGSYVLELTDRMVLGRESGRDVYRLVHDTLTLVETGTDCDPVLRAFELHLLAASGYAPALEQCRGCGQPADGIALYLAIGRGGFVCRGCVVPGEPLRAVAPATARALVRLATHAVGDVPTDVERETLRDAGAIVEQLIGAVTSGPLRTRGFLARARVDIPGGVR